MTLPPCLWCDDEPNEEPVEFFEGLAEVDCDSCGKPIFIEEVIEYHISKGLS